MTRSARIRTTHLAWFLGAGLMALIAAVPVQAQTFGGGGSDVLARKRAELVKLMRPVTVEFQEQRLQAVMDYIADVTGAELEVFWIDDRTGEGLDPEQLVTLKLKNVSYLDLLERVLDRAAVDEFTQSTWQLSKWGTIQVGPKNLLNKYRRTEIYPIQDLLAEVPNYTDAPELDLNQATQGQGGRGGGGGGRSPFQENNRGQNQMNEDFATLGEKADNIVDLIEALVEPDQWEAAGGNGGDIRYFQGNLIITAPDYMHRQVNGYPFWPAQYTSARLVEGRRYVSLNLDPSIMKIDDIHQHPITAVVGGRLIRSDENPGGGG